MRQLPAPVRVRHRQRRLAGRRVARARAAACRARDRPARLRGSPRRRGPEPGRCGAHGRRPHGRWTAGCSSRTCYSCDSPVLVVCADVSRRRALFGSALSPLRFGRPAPRFASMHCARPDFARTRRASCRSASPITRGSRASPRRPARFAHVFLLDPPPSRRLRSNALRGQRCAWRRVVPAPWLERCRGGVRARGARARARAAPGADRAVARARRRNADGLRGAALERALAGDGRHPRTTLQAARCIAVLEELDLVAADPQPLPLDAR